MATRRKHTARVHSRNHTGNGDRDRGGDWCGASEGLGLWLCVNATGARRGVRQSQRQLGRRWDSYNLRNGQLITNNSRLLSGQLKHELPFGGSRLQSGVDMQWTIPRTEGTLNGRFEDDDRVVETGVYTHLTSALTPKVDLVAAVRLDHHNRLEQAWFLSPRLSLVLKPQPTQTVRATYSRSFEQPAARLMFADFSLGPLGPLPYNIQLHGLGGSGLNVLRDCSGGPCMRVPSAFGGGASPVPAEATRMWPVVVALLSAGRGHLGAAAADRRATRAHTNFAERTDNTDRSCRGMTVIEATFCS
ncbi:MAG: TonB-dependent receptor domain-containing protein [Gemmatimonadaceae bacterium]